MPIPYLLTENGLFKGPSSLESSPCPDIVGAEMSGDGLKCSLEFAKFKVDVASTISALFGWSRPSAVSGLIIPVVVDAVKAATLRARSHISEKVLWSHPRWMDFDSSTAIGRVIDRIRVQASFFHRSPCAIFGGLRLSMTGVGYGSQFCLLAPATFMFTGQEG